MEAQAPPVHPDTGTRWQSWAVEPRQSVKLHTGTFASSAQRYVFALALVVVVAVILLLNWYEGGFVVVTLLPTKERLFSVDPVSPSSDLLLIARRHYKFCAVRLCPGPWRA
jgi:hypothetical protein